ncbi:PTS sugar transporter subunit IIC [Desulfocurvibacter africanus]|uniref:PTS sugar transporter subunit IIC n=1 Tax=Desulfocurvibacter africanus TaxID=873 RepID=UPI002377F30F|nr:PTS sugar transporter subunit IIC [Desulfocurvibacter africanus]
MFSLFRFQLNIGLLERPLAIGLVWGLLFGDLATAISISLFFELFWMDLIPAGTFIPPQMAASTLAALTLVEVYHFTAPPLAVLAIIACLPLAWLGTRIEAMERERQNKSYNELLRSSRGGMDAFSPGGLVRKGFVRMAIINWLFFLVSSITLVWIAGLVLPFLQRYVVLLPVKWWHVWFGASLGGLLSIRFRPGYILLAVAAAATAFAAYLANLGT